MKGIVFSVSSLLSVFVSLSPSVGLADSGVVLGVPVESELSETGFGPTPFFSVTLTGNFVVGGSNSRVAYSAQWNENDIPPPQQDPFDVTITGIPSGSTIVKAFANWSYLALDPPYLSWFSLNWRVRSRALHNLRRQMFAFC